MTLEERIAQDLKQAMLQKNEAKKSLLRVLIGEFNRKGDGKGIGDAKATDVIKGMIENAKLVNNNDEIVILEEYMPKQLTKDQLDMHISQFIEEKKYSSVKDMGKLMNDLKATFPGQYDGKLASELVKERLK